MPISSRTPEGAPNTCPVCGAAVKLDPSTPPGDAPCPNCGHLLWFDAAAGEVWELLNGPHNRKDYQQTVESWSEAQLDECIRYLDDDDRIVRARAAAILGHMRYIRALEELRNSPAPIPTL